MSFCYIFYKERLQILYGDILEDLKIKPLTESQIIISLDRLTRFKPTEDKYTRVFKDIITSNLIYPKYKKSELSLMDYNMLVQLAELIFKLSLENFNTKPSADYSINKKLLEYEKSIFKFDENVEKLLNNKIDYSSMLKILDKEKDLVVNLKWLKSLAQNSNHLTN